MGARRSTARQSTNYRIIEKRHFAFDSFNSDCGDHFNPSAAFAAAKRFCAKLPPTEKYEFYVIQKHDGHYQINPK